MRVREFLYVPNGRPDPTEAFTRLDLLAVLGAAALVALLQVKGTASRRLHGQLGVCLNNKERLTLAWRLYAEDNNGRLMGNLDGGDTQSLSSSNKTWVLGYLDFAGSPANTNTLYLTQYSPLAPYEGRAAEIFKCPADLSLSYGTRGPPRVRSASMNRYIGDRAFPYSAGYRQFVTTADIVSLPPSRLFVFLDEREESINDGNFVVDMSSPNNADVMWLQARSSSRVNSR